MFHNEYINDKKSCRCEDPDQNFAQDHGLLLGDSILFHIFSYVEASDLIRFTEVCKTWNRIALDQLLWKALFYKEWKTTRPIAPGSKSWLSEYKRLKYHAPLRESEVLTQHKGRVLHVSFSHDGSMFASTSKDKSIKLWNSDYPASVRYDFDTSDYYWEYAQFSQFNENDTLLLVCGKNIRGQTGEIMIFDIVDGFLLVGSASNVPFDVFGAWYGDRCFLSGRSLWFGRGNTTTTIWKNNVHRNTEPAMTKLYRFRNTSANFVGSLMIASFASGEEDPRTVRYLIFTTGYETGVPHVISFKKIRVDESNETTFDPVDRSIDVRGNIMGMALSPDQKSLYVNKQPFSENRGIVYDMVICVVDLVSLSIVGSTFTSHKSLMINDFIFLDISRHYVASGSEGKSGFLWDRHYGNCLGIFPHNNVVNCSVFNPLDSETLITASDDHVIKIWRSKNRMKELEGRNTTLYKNGNI